ncbi:MAG TPA: hypothetical protein VGF99_20855, partial [Myxococcota bacterium]
MSTAMTDLHKPLLPVEDARAHIFAACASRPATASSTVATLTDVALRGDAPCLATTLKSARAMPAF